MARNHARIHAAIWQDPDFIRLSASPQRLYLFLLSQSNLSHLGVLPLTLRRWTKACADYSLGDVSEDMGVLIRAGFVVVDQDAEELLVRSLLRNDGVYKQPNVLRGAIASVPSVQSVGIKRALMAEVDRIDLCDVSEEKGRRTEARTLLDELRRDLETPDGTPPEPTTEPFTEPIGDLPTHGRAQPLVLSPSPSPLSKTSPSPLRGDALPEGFAEFWDEYPRRVGKQDAIKAYRKALKRTDALTILAGACRYANDPNREAQYTAHPATWLNRGSWEDDALPARLRAVGRVANDDATLRRWMDQATGGQLPELGA